MPANENTRSVLADDAGTANKFKACIAITGLTAFWDNQYPRAT